MEIDAAHSELRQIPVRLVDRNPENPRILFRADELEQLLESIRIHGVQVPISVYKDGSRYVLIDGERRLRCCLKLNKREIPALVQAKPSALSNLLLMFNIHRLREQWDLLTIALKLPRAVQLLEEELGHPPSERHIAAQMGLTLAIIRRCKLLMNLPEKYKQRLLSELQRPKSRQRLSEDLFIEMERSLKTVARAMPEVIQDLDEVRDALIDKYERGVITNIVQFRKVGKIARAKKVDANPERAASALTKLFQRNQYSIDNAFEDSVSEAYSERDLKTRVVSLLDRLEAISSADLNDELRADLTALRDRIQALLVR